ncbi:class I adenylate-forming enzyme family protein [Compostimonas suwonensis]|uniref:Acyl-CoA synthetase (AMP-forming)/AMP-acid ligase II n=1 Tax=Compostimonas suwonensis TaxID=1048394 RepID=A0A2M9BVV0_9MICO|nr:AMP-binding protein [Compostimonas suwonensis]PJJ62071.1 acyl-CoA synthetase (AMP-forming)/AMP-acid ligase II [Compostimonas suwonensis]
MSNATIETTSDGTRGTAPTTATTPAPASAPNSDYDPSLLKSIFEQHFTYAAGVERNTHRFAGKRALTDSDTGRSWTYAEFGAVAGQLVGGLAAHGVGVGDVVCYQLMNRPEFAFLYVATQGLRAVGSPMNFRLAPGETAYILDDSRPAVFVYEAADAANVATALELAEFRPPVLVAVGESDGELVEGSLRFDDLLDADAPSFRAPEGASVWDETTRLYTSGTTGRPKAVPLTSLNEVLTAHDVIMHMPLSSADRTMNMSPWFHRGGTYCAGPNTVLYVGAEAVTLPRFDAGRVLDLVEEHGITFVIGAPTNLERLADAQESQPRDLATLTGIVTMGAPFERQAALRYQKVLTPNISNGYGTTEAFWNTFLPGDELTTFAGAAGRACIDDDVVVVAVRGTGLGDPGDQVAKDGSEIGEVAVRSVKSGYSYRHNPEEEAKKFRDGWFFAGDLATWNDQEVITVIGRKDDMVISGGENVHPVQVEEVLSGHPGVADSIVVGKPDAEWGQLVVAYVVRRAGELADAAAAATELDRYCRDSTALADYKRPRLYTFVEELPYTATGKKQHFKLQDQSQADFEAGVFFRP